MKKSAVQILKEKLLNVLPSMNTKNIYHVLLVYGKGSGEDSLNFSGKGELKNRHHISKYGTNIDLMNLIQHYKSLGMSVINIIDVRNEKNESVKDAEKIANAINKVLSQHVVESGSYVIENKAAKKKAEDK